MSFIGIDVGTSSTKVGVFAESGELLALASVAVDAPIERAGECELAPDSVWVAVQKALARVAAHRAVQHDPPKALAISASGDEVFPVDAASHPLGPCLMSADARGFEQEAATRPRDSARGWYQRCGHIPERMDPVNRLLWWRKRHPHTAARATRFLGWHEFLTLKLCGRAVTDPSLAAKWLSFDRTTGRWCPNRLREFEIDPALLPEIAGWGESVGTPLPSVAASLGLPHELVVAVGGFDCVCTALGLGVSTPGIAGLACGTWEVLVAPADRPGITNAIVDARLPIVAYPGPVRDAVLWQSPNGASAANWAARLTGQTRAKAESAAQARGALPPDLIAVPHLAGSVGLWPDGRQARGAILGLTAATTPADIYSAVLEGVAHELALAVRLVAGAGIPVSQLRAGGGGTRSETGMQFKADATGLPIDVCAQPEPGAFGAALLAQSAVAGGRSACEMAAGLTRVVRRYEPNGARAAASAARLSRYRALVPTLAREQSEARTPSRPPRRQPELSTPTLVVDLDAFDANVAAAQRLLKGTGKSLRPHFKTHGVPALALRQLGPTVGGFTCATVTEMETLVAAGARDVLLANEIVGPEKIRRIAALAERARVIVAVDAPEPLLEFSAAARDRGVVVEVLVDVDTGLDRCGVRGAAAAQDLALAAAETGGLRFTGIMGYEGRLRAALPDRADRVAHAFSALAEAKYAIESAGLEVAVVSACGTATFADALGATAVTEIQAGTYALMEPDLEPLNLPFRPAVRIVGSVISRRSGQVVLDIGRRSVGCDGGLPLAIDPRARLLRVNDEHTVLAWEGALPELGEHVALRPTQNRTTFKLHSRVWLSRDDKTVDCVPIAANIGGALPDAPAPVPTENSQTAKELTACV